MGAPTEGDVLDFARVKYRPRDDDPWACQMDLGRQMLVHFIAVESVLIVR